MSDTKLKILFISSEAAPFAKTGGLADVSGSLPVALRELGHDVRVFIPFYRMVKNSGYEIKEALPSLPIPILDRQEKATVLESEHKNVKFYFLKQDKYYDRDELYGTADGDYTDNAERFIYFSKAVLEATKQLDFRPDIIHCQDWQTGLIPVYLKSTYRDNLFFHNTASMFTIHNLAYQGVFWHWDIHLTGLGWEYFVPNWIEFYGKINLMKAGILHADSITTVSKQYAKEIQTKEFGCNLEKVLHARKNDLYGLINGIDYQQFDPANDPHIPQAYNASCPEKKSINKKALQEYYGLPAKDVPIIGMVSRLADQKGFDLLAQAMNDLLKTGCQLAILGTGTANYHELLQDIAKKHPTQVGLKLAYDIKLAQLVYAGSDLFLMPSRYEPCGLGQLISLRYGTIPIVRYTGGLADTVEEFGAQTMTGTGFGFTEYTPQALLSAVKRAIEIYKQAPLWNQLVQNAFAADFSWDNSAKKYVELYNQIRRKHRGWQHPKQKAT